MEGFRKWGGDIFVPTCGGTSMALHEWNVPNQHQPSIKEPAASGRGLIGQSVARINFQKCNLAARLAWSL